MNQGLKYTWNKCYNSNQKPWQQTMNETGTGKRKINNEIETKTG